jgi:hypothetical protein
MQPFTPGHMPDTCHHVADDAAVGSMRACGRIQNSRVGFLSTIYAMHARGNLMFVRLLLTDEA